MKYTIKDFQREFPNEDVCLDYLFAKKFPDTTGWYRVAGRKAYANAQGAQVFPVAGTIFEKSSTPLTLWFFAIFLFSASKNGVSAKELERQLGVTYKTAWRMAKQIRSLMGGDSDPLSGIVEVDETLIGGVRRMSAKMSNKTTVMGMVMGMVERGGRVKAGTVPSRDTHIVLGQLTKHVEKGSHLMTDEFAVYRKAPKLGYTRDSVVHSKHQYAVGNTHTNTIEGFWSQLKRSLHGTYHAVSPKHLQAYVDEFAFRYNHRTLPVFQALMARI